MKIMNSQLETNRIKNHLQAVEQKLRICTPKNLTPDLQRRREKYLELLHQYWMQGEFPRNYTSRDRQIPCFIDRDGRACAVANLLLSTGESKMANRIASQANNAYITEMNFEELEAWVAQSGLTLEELSLIQPTYDFMKNNTEYLQDILDDCNSSIQHAEEILADCYRSIQLSRNLAQVYYNRGRLYYDREKTELALTDYNKALELDPNLASAYINRGLLYHDREKTELALTDYNKALELDPNLAIAYINRGRLYAQQRKLDLALTDYDKSIELNPNLAEAYYNRGLLYYDRGKPDLALADYNKAIDLNHNDANV
jgi:tetratricopeptide (TPR) repeat protein